MQIPAIKTWFDRQHGIVSVDDDVLGVVRDVRAIDDRLQVFYNEQSQGFDIVESCLDGTDRLVFSVKELDARVVNRLRQADQWRGRADPAHMLSEEEDFLTEMDEANEEMLQERQAELGDRLKAEGEKLAYYLDMPLKGNAGYKESIFIKENPLGQDATPDHS